MSHHAGLAKRTMWISRHQLNLILRSPRSGHLEGLAASAVAYTDPGFTRRSAPLMRNSAIAERDVRDALLRNAPHHEEKGFGRSAIHIRFLRKRV